MSSYYRCYMLSYSALSPTAKAACMNYRHTILVVVSSVQRYDIMMNRQNYFCSFILFLYLCKFTYSIIRDVLLSLLANYTRNAK